MRLGLILGAIALVVVGVLLLRRRAVAGPAGGGQPTRTGPLLNPGDSIGGVTVGQRKPDKIPDRVVVSSADGIVTSVAECPPDRPVDQCFGSYGGAIRAAQRALEEQNAARAAGATLTTLATPAAPGLAIRPLKPAPITTPATATNGGKYFSGLCTLTGVC